MLDVILTKEQQYQLYIEKCIELFQSRSAKSNIQLLTNPDSIHEAIFDYLNYMYDFESGAYIEGARFDCSSGKRTLRAANYYLYKQPKEYIEAYCEFSYQDVTHIEICKHRSCVHSDNQNLNINKLFYKSGLYGDVCIPFKLAGDMLFGSINDGFKFDSVSMYRADIYSPFEPEQVDQHRLIHPVIMELFKQKPYQTFAIYDKLSNRTYPDNFANEIDIDLNELAKSYEEKYQDKLKGKGKYEAKEEVIRLNENADLRCFPIYFYDIDLWAMIFIHEMKDKSPIIKLPIPISNKTPLSQFQPHQYPKNNVIVDIDKYRMQCPPINTLIGEFERQLIVEKLLDVQAKKSLYWDDGDELWLKNHIIEQRLLEE